MSNKEQTFSLSTNPISLNSPEVVEAVAAQAHTSWAGWIAWMFEKLDETHASGETFRARWLRQAMTPYAELSEQEKESDRIEARRYIDAMLSAYRDE